MEKKICEISNSFFCHLSEEKNDKRGTVMRCVEIYNFALNGFRLAGFGLNKRKLSVFGAFSKIFNKN